MDERVALVSLTLLALAGCAGNERMVDDVVVYEHHWTYGPGYYRTDGEGDPIFTDEFYAQVGGGWRVDVSSRVQVGNYTLVLRFEGATRTTITQEGSMDMDGEVGPWLVEILTDAAGDAVPQGTVDASILAPA